MTLVVESASLADRDGAAGGPTSLTVTAPTGIQTGDLLLCIAGYTGSDVTISGFTTALTVGSYVRVLYKYAVLADESAANYLITSTNDTGIAAIIYRISGYSSGDPLYFSASNSVAYNKSTSSDVTITRSVSTARPNQQLNFICVTVSDDDPDITDIKSPFITTSAGNPTWTKNLPTLSAGFNTTNSANTTRNATVFFHAASTTTTSTTEYGYTLEGPIRNYDRLSDIYFTIHDPQNVTADIGRTDATPNMFGITATQVTVAPDVSRVDASPTIHGIPANATTPTQWVNETKPSTEWINEQK